MAAIAPTEAQMQSAFEQMRGAGWPRTLAELRLDTSTLATARVRIVLGAAGHIARGGHPCRPDLSGPIRAPYTPAPAAHHPHHSPVRRHGDAVDLKRAASGEKDDD